MKITTKFITTPGGRYDTLQIALLGQEGKEASFWMRNFDQETYHCTFELDTEKLFQADLQEAKKLAELLVEGISLTEGEGTKEAGRTDASKTEWIREAAAQFSSGQEVLKLRVSRTYYGFDEEMEPEKFLPEGMELTQEDWQTYGYFERCEQYEVDLKSKTIEASTTYRLHTDKEQNIND